MHIPPLALQAESLLTPEFMRLRAEKTSPHFIPFLAMAAIFCGFELH